MKFISIKEALKKGKGSVSLRGWVFRERKFADKIFIVLRDASGIIQCVIKQGIVSDDLFTEAESILMESSIE